LRIVDATDRSVGTVEAVRAQIEKSGLSGRVELTGPKSPEELDELYARADIFVLASHYEGYGMVLAEALARGLPIVTTTGGAAAETVPDHAALKVAPGQAVELQRALLKLMTDGALRQQLAEAAWLAGQ